jgi:hypothetical protein
MKQIHAWEANSSSVIQEIIEFRETRRFITVFTKVKHLSQYWDRLIHFTPSHHIYLAPIWILFHRLRVDLPSGLFPSGVSHHKHIHYFIPPGVAHGRSISSPFIWPSWCLMVRSINSEAPLHNFSSLLLYPLSKIQISSSVSYSRKSSPCILSSIWLTKFHTHIKQVAKLQFCMHSTSTKF